MSPKVLDQVLCGVPRVVNENVLVGYDTADDAGVYRLDKDTALVQTVDFFTPIVDDGYTFGAIAAANSLSDVYAMGGRPLSALSMVCYPGKGNLDVLRAILTGGAEKMREAGCVILGGHSVNDDEVKFGYAVTGQVHPDRYWPNAGAREGDLLVFTKAIGTGVIATALKRGIATDDHVSAMTASMLELNRAAAEAAMDLTVHGCTDITGFGLIGHGREMADGSHVTLEIESARIRLLPGALDYARAGAIPGGLKNNREFAAPFVHIASGVEEALVQLLHDPQTSGGLLLSMPADDARRYTDRFPAASIIGRAVASAQHAIRIL